MTKRNKTILAVLVVLFMACVCCGAVGVAATYFMSRAMVYDPAETGAIGAEIAEYTLPEGYSEIFGMRLLGMQVVAIAPTNLNAANAMLIMLMKIANTENVDQLALEKQLAMAVQQQSGFQNLKLSLDKIDKRVINDQEVPLTVRTGTDDQGTPYRQVSGLFNSHQGSVFMLAQGAEATWDQAALDSLLDSIR